MITLIHTNYNADKLLELNLDEKIWMSTTVQQQSLNDYVIETGRQVLTMRAANRRDINFPARLNDVVKLEHGPLVLPSIRHDILAINRIEL